MNDQPPMNDVSLQQPDFAAAKDLPSLHALLDRVQMKNGWAKPTPSIYPSPRPRFVAAHWRYADARAALSAAGDLVATEWAERRNLIMANPVPGNDYATVASLVGAYQMVKAGETARSHRHTPNAMRVVIEAGPETYTVVDGQAIPMLPGDVLLTPNWCFHGHANHSASDAYWADFLDVPLVQFLGPMFFELHPESLQPTEAIDARSAMRFAYADYRPHLLEADQDDRGVRLLTLGPPGLTTFDRTAIAIDAGGRFAPPRSTANEIAVVIEGRGRTRCGDRLFDWGPGDMLATPGWTEADHEVFEAAVLVRMSDAPLMKALGWWRVASDS